LFLPAWLAGVGGFDYANENITFNLLLGGGLITAANILLQLRKRPEPRSDAAPPETLSAEGQERKSVGS
jgi:hypothetical protein